MYSALSELQNEKKTGCPFGGAQGYEYPEACSEKKNSLSEIDSIFSKKPKIFSKPNVMKTYIDSQACQNMCNKGK